MYKLAILGLYIMFNLQQTCWLRKEESDIWNRGVQLSWLWSKGSRKASESNSHLESIQNGILLCNPKETQLQEVTLYITKVVSASNPWRLVDIGNESNWWDHIVRRSVWTSLLVFYPEKFVAAFLTANTSPTL